jgi:hypothetical protein
VSRVWKKKSAYFKQSMNHRSQKDGGNSGKENQAEPAPDGGDDDGLFEDSIEEALLKRNEDLIDLALALYGVNPGTLRQLYIRGRRHPSDGAESFKLEGLRVAVLSNERSMDWRLPILGFPTQIIGASETDRLLREGNDRELRAMLGNGHLDERVLQSLYASSEIPGGRADERRQHKRGCRHPAEQASMMQMPKYASATGKPSEGAWRADSIYPSPAG